MVNPSQLRLDEVLAALPDPWPDDLFPRIQSVIHARRETIVVLDDDPTGTQTVYATPVLTDWSVDTLAAELGQRTPLVYLLTNSRSLTVDQARALNREVGERLREASHATGRLCRVISRGDSTLRGHYPAEVTALAEALDLSRATHLLVPFFAEGGRYTLADVHYVLEGDTLVPAAETGFAQDPGFGYQHSNLRDWVEERSGGAVRAHQVRSITLDHVRQGGPAVVARQLRECPPGGVCIANAAHLRDLEVLVTGLLAAESDGRQYLCRTAASFVQVRAGLPPCPLLEARKVAADLTTGGLFVVGSYVTKTTEQLRQLLDQGGDRMHGVELDVDALLDASRHEAALTTAAQATARHLDHGHDVVLYTSRRFKASAEAAGNLEIGREVSSALVEVIRRVDVVPRFLVAKGGITSSDVATEALGVRRAMVLGQVLPGVPVWELGPETRFPELRYVVFPGNVGAPDALLKLYQALRPNAPPSMPSS